MFRGTASFPGVSCAAQDPWDARASAPLELGIDAASLLSLGWAAASPALSAALPAPSAAPSAPHNALRAVPKAKNAAQHQLQERPAAQEDYDSDATLVPSGDADTKPPALAYDARSPVSLPTAKLPQPPIASGGNAVSMEAANEPIGTPSWLSAALDNLQSTAVICDQDGETTCVIGRRVAFALLGAVSVGDHGDERALPEGLHVGRCRSGLFSSRRTQFNLLDLLSVCLQVAFCL